MNKIQVGANIVCRINGKIWGAVTGLQYRLLSPHIEDRGVDSMVAAELSPTITSVMGTVQVMMIRDNEMLEGIGATQGLPYIATEQYFSLSIEDRSDGFSTLRVDRALVEEQQWNMATKTVVTGQFTFKGLQGLTHYNQ
jgi:hypothetical protein